MTYRDQVREATEARIVLLLAGTPGRAWTSEELRSVLHRTRGGVIRHLNRMVTDGLLKTEILHRPGRGAPPKGYRLVCP